MEKKTIGKFISILRKSNGMTQRELGEKLFVSDKTISRWECDECTPELSMIPSIAEIFGVTTDELLRGERNSIAHDSTNEGNQTAKSNKQLKLMLDRSNRKYKKLTLISVGITIIGFIAAVIANFSFSAGLIAFCIMSTFCTAGEICQICFAINARILSDEENDSYADKIRNTNNSVTKTVVSVSYINALMLVFALPLVTLIDGRNYGLFLGSWLGYGLLFAVIAFIIFYIFDILFVRKILCNRGLFVFDIKQKEKLRDNTKLLKKALLIATSIALILVTCIVVWNLIGLDAFLEKNVFYNCDDFKEFVENDYDNWYRDTYGTVLINGEAVAIPPSDPEYPYVALDHQKIYGGIQNSDGEDICTYCYNPDLYWKIEFTPSSYDKMPVTVITDRAVINARNLFQTINSLLYILILIDFIVSLLVYARKTRNRKKS